MEILIVGSGAGGATLAKELSTQGVSVTVLESGRYHKLGTERRAMGFYTGSSWKMRPGEMSKEGAEMLRTVMVGGSTMVTLGNGVRSLQDELDGLGIDLEEEFQEVETELNVKPLPEEFMGDRTRILMEAAEELGYNARPMPKFVDFSRCKKCGMCVTGCPYGAKWTAQNFLAEARKAGARILTESHVEHVLHSNGEIKGVHVRGKSGRFDIEAEHVILAAGGIGTPKILQRSGLEEAGSDLFADLFVNTYGMIDSADWGEEMGYGHDNRPIPRERWVHPFAHLGYAAGHASLSPP